MLKSDLPENERIAVDIYLQQLDSDGIQGLKRVFHPVPSL